MVVVGRAQAPTLGTPPPAEIPPLLPPRRPPPNPPRAPPPRVLTDSWGGCRIRTGCSRPPGQPPVCGGQQLEGPAIHPTESSLSRLARSLSARCAISRAH